MEVVKYIHNFEMEKEFRIHDDDQNMAINCTNSSANAIRKWQSVLKVTVATTVGMQQTTSSQTSSDSQSIY